MKKTCSFRLNEYTIKLIEKMAKKHNITKTEVVEIAIQNWTKKRPVLGRVFYYKIFTGLNFIRMLNRPFKRLQVG